jgi:hypothetical protein
VLGRIVPRTLVGVFLLLWAAEWYVAISSQGALAAMGTDYRTYMDAARAWLAGGSFYPARELAGPYQIELGAVLYPPIALVLFVPFTVLPAPLWSLSPAVILAAVVWHHRPAPWTWVVIAACLALGPVTTMAYWYGTPTIWMAAFLALASVYSWPGVLVLLKPAIFPFAIVGIGDRRWWIAAAVLGLVSLALLPMWVDWFRVLLNARGPRANLLYAFSDLPLMAIPLAAWLGGRAGQNPGRLAFPTFR